MFIDTWLGRQSESEDFYRDLQKHKRTAEIHVYADEDHAFDSQKSLEETLQIFKRDILSQVSIIT